MKPRHWRVFWLVAALESLAAIVVYLASPSEAGSAWLFGYSRARWVGVAALLGAALLLAGAAGVGFGRFEAFSARVERVNRWLERGNRLLGVWVGLAGGVVGLAGAVLFTYLFIPVHLRSPLALGAVLLLEAIGFLAWDQAARLRSAEFWRPLDGLPRFRHLDAGQRRVFWMLAGVGVLYFLAFIPPNLAGAENPERFFTTGGDEYVIYPIPVRMLTPGNTLEQSLYFSVVYEDYHYGYPFYAISAFVLLPVRLVFGDSFGEQTRLNLLLLRQITSVLPLIGAAGVLVFLGTRFKHAWRALALFLLLLSIPGVFKYNLRFWHPDGLMVLFICLTLFFLERDRLRLGPNFVLAAVCCGLASAVKLYGFFFFAAVAGVLIASWVARRRVFRAEAGSGGGRKIILAGLAFVIVMSAALVFSNPFVFVDSARTRLVQIMTDKTGEMSQGYSDPDPDHIYRTGVDVWLPFYEYFYAEGFFLVFLLVSLAAGAVWGRNRLSYGLILAWAIPVNAYLIGFVAVKAYQYMLPGMLPLYAGAFALADLGVLPALPAGLRRAGWALVWGCVAAQFAISLGTNWTTWGL